MKDVTLLDSMRLLADRAIGAAVLLQSVAAREDDENSCALNLVATSLEDAALDMLAKMRKDEQA